MNPDKILIWLPTPLGDAVMATPALRAFRALYPIAKITFFAPAFTKQILSPSPFCDRWLDVPKGVFSCASVLGKEHFTAAILLKNSFSAALAVRLARIPRRVGYARDGRAWLLTDRIRPEKQNGVFKPLPMIDYYLNIASHLGADASNRRTELNIDPAQTQAVRGKFNTLQSKTGPLVLLVPGGAFGPSKLWPVAGWAQLADTLAEKYAATVMISVAPSDTEIAIADQIREQSRSRPMHLGQTPLSGSSLKALFGLADLVITNDTGPRHIAIALDKPVVALFGPNNPQWTQYDNAKEIRLIGVAPCVPCDKPVCKAAAHACMESITVDQVLNAADALLAGARP